jgi:hypothetical protein
VTSTLSSSAFPGWLRSSRRALEWDWCWRDLANGPVCFCQGKRYQVCESSLEPFANRADASLVMQGIMDLMTMPSAGDLVIYGIGAAEGHVSFIAEMGAHAGPSPEELHTFIIHAANITLPAPIVHPVQLYDHFIRRRKPKSRRRN